MFLDPCDLETRGLVGIYLCSSPGWPEVRYSGMRWFICNHGNTTDDFVSCKLTDYELPKRIECQGVVVWNVAWDEKEMSLGQRLR